MMMWVFPALCISLSLGYVESMYHNCPCEVAGAGIHSMGSVTVNRACVKMNKLGYVVGADAWRVNNLLDDKYEPFDVDLVVKNAKDMVGDLRPYCIYTQNCEHFVTELRYGKAESRQVRKTQKWIWATVLTTLTVGLVEWIWKIFSSRDRRKASRDRRKETEQQAHSRTK